MRSGWRDNPTFSRSNPSLGFIASSEYFQNNKPVYQAGANPAVSASAICAKVGITIVEAKVKRDAYKLIVERVYGIV